MSQTYVWVCNAPHVTVPQFNLKCSGGHYIQTWSFFSKNPTSFEPATVITITSAAILVLATAYAIRKVKRVVYGS